MSNLTSDEIISDEEYNLIEGVMCALRGTFALLGALGNIVNICTFYKMGLKDAMAVSFFILSISNFAYLITMVSMATSFLIMVSEIANRYTSWLFVDPYGIYIFAGHASRIPYIMSNFTTAFLALARCLCVAKPLRFKSMLGRRLTKSLLSSFGLFAVVSYIPVLVYIGMIPQFIASINATRVSLWISPKRQVFMDVVRVYRDAVLPFITQVIIIVSVIIMIRSLGAARKFREAHSSLTSNSVKVHSLESRPQSLPNYSLASQF